HARPLPSYPTRRSSDLEEKQAMKIDTEIRHVTKPGANLFLELGFSPEEAKRLHLASQQQINDTKQLKEQLMAELAAWIEQHHLRSEEHTSELQSRENLV